MIEPLVRKDKHMNTQVHKVKEEFAMRLQKSMDLKSYPLRGRARILSKEFGISDKAASKWLNGEAIPETSKIPILAKFLNVTSEWLLSGDCEKSDSYMSEESNELDIHMLYKNFLNDFDYAHRNDKLTPDIIKTLNQTLNLMINH